MPAYTLLFPLACIILFILAKRKPTQVRTRLAFISFIVTIIAFWYFSVKEQNWKDTHIIRDLYPVGFHGKLMGINFEKVGIMVENDDKVYPVGAYMNNGHDLTESLHYSDIGDSIYKAPRSFMIYRKSHTTGEITAWHYYKYTDTNNVK